MLDDNTFDMCDVACTDRDGGDGGDGWEREIQRGGGKGADGFELFGRPTRLLYSWGSGIGGNGEIARGGKMNVGMQPEGS